MIKKLDWEFLEDLIEELDVCRPDDGVDTFNDIYENIIIQYVTELELNEGPIEMIRENIYCNCLDSRVDLSVDKFLETYPCHEDKREKLEAILYT